MILESLANELLLDLFEYFRAVEVLRSFYGLNNRLNELISKHFLKHRLDFHRSSKKDFDLICQVYLSEIYENILSIDLSDDDDIPGEVDLFLSYGWTLDRFTNLRSVTFTNIRCGEKICDILSQCQQIIHLNLTACYFEYSTRNLLDLIWNLPNLIYCFLSLVFKDDFSLSIPNHNSTSIKHLTIIGISFHINQLRSFCQRTPQLEYLAIDLSPRSAGEQIETPIQSIRQLNLSIVDIHSDTIENLLQHLPNLIELKVDSHYLDLNGYEWESLIRNYLPKLEKFQLKMKFPIRNTDAKNHLLKSFQTPFWINEHQWFIQFHFNLDDKSNMIYLYTLPFGFTSFNLYFPIQIQTTLPNEICYDQVQRLFYRCSLQTDEIITTNFQFSNVTHLNVTLPFNQNLLLLIEKLSQLTSLDVSKPKTMSSHQSFEQLQKLIDSTNHLQSLKFSSWSENDMLTPVVLRTREINRVHLRGYDHYFTDEDCFQLSQSSLVKFCEILFIKVKTRSNIVQLINSLPNLQSLICQSKDDQWQFNSTAMTDPFIEWLYENLSKKNCLIKRDLRYKHSIRIWIDI